MGMASASAGSMFPTGNGLMPRIRKPVARMMRPPTAEKSSMDLLASSPVRAIYT